MDRSLPQPSCAARRHAAPGVCVGAAGLALAGAVGLGLPHAHASQAQLKSDGCRRRRGRAPASFADIVERVKPAVVSIQVTSGGSPRWRKARRAAPRASVRATSSPICPRTIRSTSSSRTCRRSCAAVPAAAAARRRRRARASSSRADGYVVTNNHVIDGAGKIQVSFDKDNKFEAELVGTDQRTDIALLKIKASQDLPVRQVRRQAARASATGSSRSATRSVSAAR